MWNVCSFPHSLTVEALPKDGAETGGGEAAVTVEVGSDVCLN